MLEPWRMRSTLSVSSLQGPLWPEGVAPKGILWMGQIELFDILNWEQTNDLYQIELLEIELFDHLTKFNRIVSDT